MDDTFDIIIVGGGIIGTMTTYCIVNSERERRGWQAETDGGGVAASLAFVCLSPMTSTSSKSAGLLAGRLAESAGQRLACRRAEEERVRARAARSVVALPGSVRGWGSTSNAHSPAEDEPPPRRAKRKAGAVHSLAAQQDGGSVSASAARAWLHAESRVIYESLVPALAPSNDADATTVGLGWLHPPTVVSFRSTCSSTKDKVDLGQPVAGTADVLARDSAQLDVRSLLAALAADMGAYTSLTVIENMAVVELGEGGTRLVLESVGDGGGSGRRVLRAGRTVLATGAWTNGIRTDGSLRLPTISFVKAHACHFQVSTETPPTVTFTDQSDGSLPRVDPEVYVRPGGAVLVSGCVEEDNDAPVPPEGPHTPATATAGAHDRLAASVKSLVTDTLVDRQPANNLERDGCSVPRSTCYLPASADGMPIIGQLGDTALYLGLGHSCWGISEGAATGRALAALVLDEPLPTNLSALSPNRFA
uniref:FAD dependent oxidoreductase domain-containing protein n=1 Tax=Sexangularia sp. CB-2014 TaxID=1486929 RepID=A0A7S1VE89_9EUKA